MDDEINGIDRQNHVHKGTEPRKANLVKNYVTQHNRDRNKWKTPTNQLRACHVLGQEL